jgi:hypothetical protein
LPLIENLKLVDYNYKYINELISYSTDTIEFRYFEFILKFIIPI